jgi:hypothetical protein
MQNFYRDVLGFIPTRAGSDYAVFTQRDGYPSVILEQGGSSPAFDPRDTPWADNAVRAFPVFISLMTSDIQSAYAHLQSRNVKVLRDLVSNEVWSGTDLHIADSDGNGIQVVQYR